MRQESDQALSCWFLCELERTERIELPTYGKTKYEHGAGIEPAKKPILQIGTLPLRHPCIDMKHSQQTLIESLQQFYLNHQRIPTCRELGLNNLPTHKVYENHFGSWKNAILAAGFNPTVKVDTNHYLICYQCSKPIIVKHSTYAKSNTLRFFCTHSCARKTTNAGRLHSTATKDRIKQTQLSYHPRKHNWKDDISGPFTKIFLCTCKYTGQQFYSPTHKQVHPTEITSRTQYRYLCRFTFSICKFPNWFNCDLLKIHGMYKASNRGNNLQGISRDHMLSIFDGYNQNISPTIINHPANCQLISHPDNQMKNINSILTLDQLAERIKQFELLYPTWKSM